MIALDRELIHVLRSILRQALKIPARGPGPWVHFYATSESLRIRGRTADCAAEYCLPGPFEPLTFSVPFAALARWQATQRGLANFELVETGELSVTWIEGNVPQHQLLGAGEPEPTDFPPMPAELVENPPSFLQALQAAAATTDDASSRNALGCLHLRGGKQGRVAGKARVRTVRSGAGDPADDQDQDAAGSSASL